MTDGVTRRPLWTAFAGLAAAVVVLDQLAKAWLVSFLAPGQSTPVIDDLLRLVHSQNTGGLFGLLKGQAAPFAALSLIVMALIVGYHARSGRSPYLTVTLGLLLGGAIGSGWATSSTSWTPGSAACAGIRSMSPTPRSAWRSCCCSPRRSDRR
jgi:hypothetical protein